MKKFAVKSIAAFLVVLFVCSSLFALGALAGEVTDSTTDGAHVLVLKSESLSVVKGKTIQMTASVSNVKNQPLFIWSTSDPTVATVVNGTVRGIGIGRAVIYVRALVDGELLTGEFPVNVITKSNTIKDLLDQRQVLSYQYSYVDDFYYTNDKEAWQYGLGFGKIYDIVAPYLLLEYDYIRVFFTYEDKDWMLQMWKGQYGMVFYGGEIGIYNRKHSDKGVNEWTMYACPKEEDWPMMEITLYHQNLLGFYEREFSREYDKYWWCTGFKNGSLRIQEPAKELRLNGRMTFKTDEMTALVAQGFAECGFKTSNTKDVAIDSYYTKGKDIYFSWQNISEAESTMAIKFSAGLLTAISLWPIYPILLPMVSGFVLLVLLVSAVI